MGIEANNTVARRAIRVCYKSAWAEQWTEVAEIYGAEALWPVSATHRAGPSPSEAELRWHAGVIKYENQASYQAFDPIEWRDKFIRIDAEKPDGSGEYDTLFVGIVTKTERHDGGNSVLNPDGSGQGVYVADQLVHAEGIESILDKVVLAEAYVTNDGKAAVAIDHCPVFNERFVRGVAEIGNRSAGEIVIDPVGGESTYIFADDAEPWTALDILVYLLIAYTDIELIGNISGEYNELSAIIPPRLDLAGRTLKQAIDALVDRRRGLGWCLRYDPLSDYFDFHVYSVLDQAVTVGDQSLAANSEIVSEYDAGGLGVQDVVQLKTVHTAYGTIRVLGERVRSMFTLSFADSSTLAKAWTDEEETAYKAGGTGTTAAEKDAERGTDKFRQVYTWYIPPANWNWQVDDGDSDLNPVCPTIEPDGSIDYETAAPTRQWLGARVFLDRLLIPREAASDQVHAEYLPPIAIIQEPDSNKYVLVDDPGGDLPNASLRMLDNMMGVEVKYNPNHLLALNHWTGTGTDKRAHPPKFDYETLYLTVAIETDERLKRVVTVAGNDAEREMVIEVPEAHLWWIVSGTVLGVTNGALVRHQNTGYPDESYPTGCLIRDDRDKIDLVAAQAQAWYGKERSAITFTVRDIDVSLQTFAGNSPAPARLQVGNLLASLKDTDPINTVITEVHYDFAAWSTRYTTAYAELDFLRS